MALSKTPNAERTSSVFRVFRTTRSAEIHTAIQSGKVPSAGVFALRSDLRLNAVQLASIGVSPRTILRIEGDKTTTLTAVQADRAYRLARTVDLAVELIGDRDKAISWMTTPHAYLGGEAPIQMLETEIGADLVTESLYAIAYGATA